MSTEHKLLGAGGPIVLFTPGEGDATGEYSNHPLLREGVDVVI